MTAAPVHIGGVRVGLDPLGAMVWQEAGVLAVADLHLEKGSASAVRGHLVPPWDTRVTLDRLAALLRRYRPSVVVALGDSFHDARGVSRMHPGELERLSAMARGAQFVWVLGNHDPLPPEGIPGDAVEAFEVGPLVFRHIAAAVTPGRGEVCGHHHPKACVPARGAAVTRPCFVADARRLMLPAFGAYAGGLDVRHAAIAGLFPRGGRVFLLGRDRLFSFSLAQVAALA